MAGGPQLFWIEEPFGGRLGVSRRPLGFEELEHDVAAWRFAGLDVVVSMMEPEEAEELGLSNQGLVCHEHGIELISCPVPDHGVPEDAAAVLRCVDRVLRHLTAGKRVAAHCFAGIGRSPLLVASVLVRHGLDADTAWDRIMVARGLQLPDTDEQWQWVAELADRIRASGGR